MTVAIETETDSAVDIKNLGCFSYQVKELSVCEDEPRQKTTFQNLPNELLPEIRKYLTNKESAMLEFACKRYWLAVRYLRQSGYYTFGSEKAYVKRLSLSDGLRNDPEKMRTLHTIYVTDKVFQECEFNPAEFPSLKHVFIKSTNSDGSVPNSFFDNENILALRDATLDQSDPFELKIFSMEDIFHYCLVKWDASSALYQNWLPFLLDYRDWGDDDEAFDYWDQLLEKQIRIRMHSKLFEFEKLNSFRKGRDPFALESLFHYQDYVNMNNRDYFNRTSNMFRSNTNPNLFDGLSAVKSGKIEHLKIWLNEEHSSKTISRVLSFALDFTTEQLEKTPSIDEMAGILIESGNVDFNYVGQNSETLLMVALKRKRWDVYQVLQKNVQDKEQNMTLLMAADDGEWSIVKQIAERGADVNAVNQDGATLLMVACEEGNLDAVNWLLEKCADVHCKDNNGTTALIKAVDLGCPEIVKRLLEAGARVNDQNYQGMTALMYASRNDFYFSCERLLENGADVHLKDSNGKTALIYAAERNALSLAERLLEQGATVEKQDAKGNNLLIQAASSGNLHLTELLLDRGASVNFFDNAGMTTLMHASIKRHFRIVKLLLKRGSIANTTDNQGHTALFYAVTNKFPAIAQILIPEMNDVGELRRVSEEAEWSLEIMDLLDGRIAELSE